jgi:hypothetical protein
MNNLKNNIMDKIRTGEVKQKPSWYFILHTMGIALLGILLFFISIFWSSFLMLTLREYSMFTQIGIGFTTLLQSILFWIFITCGIGFGVLCYRFLRDHTSLYRYRHIYSGIMVTAIVLGIGFSMNLIDREADWLTRSSAPVPGFSSFNRSMRPPRPEIITEGKVLLIYDDTIMIQEKNYREKIYVKIPDSTLIMKNISLDDHVAVVGIKEHNIIYAQDIIVK